MSVWTCKETTQLGRIRACAARGARRETWHLDAAFADPHNPDRWWFAASDSAGNVGAFAAIEGTRAHLFGDDEEAVEAMARTMLRSQQIHTSRESHRHVLFGPARVVNPFWRIFEAVGRQVVADRRPALMCSTDGGKGSRRMRLTVGDADDQKTCVAFLGEHGAEADGADPRKIRPQAFSRQVARTLAAGRMLVGRELAPGSVGGRAMFVAEVTPVGVTQPTADSEAGAGAASLLWPWHVPLPFRGRKILVAGALLEATRQGPGADRPVWLLVEGEALHLAAARAGYEHGVAWREIAMLG